MALFRKFVPKKHLHLAIAQMNAGDHLQALQTCEMIMQHAPRHPDGARLMGQICERLGNEQRAATYYRVAVEGKPNYANLVSYGRVCRRLGDLVEATAVLERAHKLEPESVEIMTVLAEIFEERKIWTKAVGMRKAISDQAPDDPDALCDLAHCAFLARLMDEAVTLCTRLLNRAPEHPRGLRLLAECMVHRNHHERAMELYDRALRAQPDDWEGHYQLAGMYLELGDQGTARKHYQSCLRHKADHPEAHRQLIELYKQERMWLEAEIVLKHLLATRGEDRALCAELGDVCYEQLEFNASVTAYQQARNLGPADEALDAKYVSAAIHAGRAEEVVDLAHRLASRSVFNIHYQYLYASSLHCAGDVDGATEVVKGVTASEEDHPEFCRLRTRLLSREAPPQQAEGPEE